MDERAACAQLKKRFEAAGFRIKENQTFDDAGVRFDIDGYDAARRVGYEYVTDEAGDGWDVDDDVIAALAESGKRGEVHVLVVDEADAPDAAALDAAIDAFLAGLPEAVRKPAAAASAGGEADDVVEAADVVEAEADEAAAGADAPARPKPAPPAPAPTKKAPPPTPKGAKKKPARKSR